MVGDLSEELGSPGKEDEWLSKGGQGEVSFAGLCLRGDPGPRAHLPAYKQPGCHSSRKPYVCMGLLRP